MISFSENKAQKKLNKMQNVYEENRLSGGGCTPLQKRLRDDNHKKEIFLLFLYVSVSNFFCLATENCVAFFEPPKKSLLGRCLFVWLVRRCFRIYKFRVYIYVFALR